MRTNYSRRGTSLVEVLITLSIISILSLVVWRLFFIGHATFDEGIWRNEREQESKVGLRMLEEDIKNLATLSGTWGSKLAVNETEHFNFQYNGDAMTPAGVTQGKQLFRFFSCRQPLKAGVGPQSQPAIIEKVECEINDKRELEYRKWVGEIPFNEYKDENSLAKLATLNPESLSLTLKADKVLLHDVDCVQLLPYGTDTEITKSRPMKIVVKMIHITRRKKSLKPFIKELQRTMNVKARTL